MEDKSKKPTSERFPGEEVYCISMEEKIRRDKQSSRRSNVRCALYYAYGILIGCWIGYNILNKKE